MRPWPFLKLAIPLGTLAALALAYGIQQLVAKPDPPPNIKRPPPTTFPRLEPPVHGHALEGQISGPAGEPVERALVWVRSGDEPSFTYSDAAGVFRFGDLGPGPWQGKVLALGFEPLALSFPESAAPQAIALAKAYGPPQKLALLERAPLAGRIVAPEGFDALHCEVVLEPDAPTSIDSALPRRVECDAQGAFRIDDLIVARYALRVLPAWARGGTWPDLLAGIGSSATREFTHSSAGGELVLQLECGTIEGTLLEPITIGPDGLPLPAPRREPVEGALVELALASDPGRIWIPQATDAAGKFSLGPLPRGTYALKLHAGELTLAREVSLGAGERLKLDLLLTAPDAGH
jgi:hypothetical protein